MVTISKVTYRYNEDDFKVKRSKIYNTRKHFNCFKCNKENNSSKELALGALTFTRPQSVDTMIARYFRRWQACRRRRKRRKCSTCTRYKCNNNKMNNKIRNTREETRTRTACKVATTCPNDIIAKEKLRNMLISCCHAVRGIWKGTGNSVSRRIVKNETEKARITDLLLVNRGDGMTRNRNSHWLQGKTTKATTLQDIEAAKTVMRGYGKPFTTTTTTDTTTTRTESATSKLEKCERLIRRRRKKQQQAQQQKQQQKQQQQQPKHMQMLEIAKNPTHAHQCFPAILQQQLQQTQRIPTVPHERFEEADSKQVCNTSVDNKTSAFLYELTEQKGSIQQQQQPYNKCQKSASAVAQQQQTTIEIAQHRSWRNLIGYVVSDTTANATTTTKISNSNTTITTSTFAKHIPTTTKLTTATAICSSNTMRKSATTTTKIALSNVLAAMATQATTTTTKNNLYSSIPAFATTKTSNALIAKEIAKHAMSISTTNACVEKNSKITTKTLLPLQQQSPHVVAGLVARKSNCRSKIALTCALTDAHQIKHPNVATTTMATATAAITKTTKKRNTLTRSRKPTALFGHILTSLGGTLTVHTFVLHCLLLATVMVLATSATPLVGRNSLLLLTQQTLQKHFHNNNNSSSNNIIATSTSIHNHNHTHSQRAMAATTTTTARPIQMMDVEVLNGSSTSTNTNTNTTSSQRLSSSSIIGDNSANTLKSLSSIVEANFEQEDMSQMPIFDFGLPRNITARTSQAEATIKCRVERLDDKSVSWIRKRDLHILTVATATYTSDKRFQVTSSKDGREWMLHVKSPHVRDSGIYECQVNTEPKISMAFQLNVIEIPADSRAIMTGPADLHFKVGSAIILNCHVQQPSKRDIGPIYWYRGEHIITPFQVADEDIIYSRTSSSSSSRIVSNNGISTPQMWPPALADNEVETDVTATITNVNAFTGRAAVAGREWSAHALTTRTTTTATGASAQHDGLTNEITPDFTSRIAMETQLGDTMKSRLRISNAQTTDTGNYTCQPTTASSASVMVHVINDENPAAMQKSSASTTTTMTSMLLTLFVVVTIIKTLMTRANIIMKTTPGKPRMRTTTTTTRTPMVTTTTALTIMSQRELCRQQSNKKEVNCHQQQHGQHHQRYNNKQQNNQHQHQNPQQQQQWSQQ